MAQVLATGFVVLVAGLYLAHRLRRRWRGQGQGDCAFCRQCAAGRQPQRPAAAPAAAAPARPAGPPSAFSRRHP